MASQTSQKLFETHAVATEIHPLAPNGSHRWYTWPKVAWNTHRSDGDTPARSQWVPSMPPGPARASLGLAARGHNFDAFDDFWCVVGGPGPSKWTFLTDSTDTWTARRSDRLWWMAPRVAHKTMYI
eukprot:gene25201-biopygen20955